MHKNGGRTGKYTVSGLLLQGLGALSPLVRRSSGGGGKAAEGSSSPSNPKRASRAARSWAHASPTYIVSQPRLRLAGTGGMRRNSAGGASISSCGAVSLILVFQRENQRRKAFLAGLGWREAFWIAAAVTPLSNRASLPNVNRPAKLPRPPKAASRSACRRSPKPGGHPDGLIKRFAGVFLFARES